MLSCTGIPCKAASSSGREVHPAGCSVSFQSPDNCTGRRNQPNGRRLSAFGTYTLGEAQDAGTGLVSLLRVGLVFQHLGYVIRHVFMYGGSLA